MIVGIDASNMRGGGGITHLSQLLGAARPEEHGIRRTVVWGGRTLLDQLPRRPWLDPIHQPWLDGGYISRMRWQAAQLSKLAQGRCDLLLIPGGSYMGGYHPFVSMVQSAFPFDARERRRYGLTWMRCRLTYLRWVQARTVRHAEGVIYPSEHCRALVAEQVGRLRGRSAIVPHGVEARFVLRPRPQRSVREYSLEQPYRLLYVSIIDQYKHQWKVADGTYLCYRGPIPFSEMHTAYHAADGFVFASTCESFALPVLEAMAAGLPIACSNQPPMSEMLGNDAEYFSPEDTRDIADALERMIRSPEKRERLAQGAYARAQTYSWDRCAGETFSFLSQIANQAAEKPLAARGASWRTR
ncbi:MAG: glycosyltransferase family 1 protein [candidate division NC10 bacterium]|nr:glycosyltransferase family 1 protein [candidate division NC10 bacterium]